MAHPRNPQRELTESELIEDLKQLRAAVQIYEAVIEKLMTARSLQNAKRSTELREPLDLRRAS